MMLDIEPLVREVAPGLLSRRRASVACIATTRRKYLVFDGGMPAQPRCVVEYGDAERLLRTAHVLRTLSARLPGVVPAVVSCGPREDGSYVLIQEGLGGVPWFRVADTYGSYDLDPYGSGAPRLILVAHPVARSQGPAIKGPAVAPTRGPAATPGPAGAPASRPPAR